MGKTIYYSTKMDNQKIYGGIYKSGPSKKTDEFVMDRLQFDAEKEVAYYYLLETLAHNYMLAEEKLVPLDSSKKIIGELLELIESFDKENYLEDNSGDVHENTEKILKEAIGEDAGWVHVARSRNDQSRTDQKLFVKDNLHKVFEKLSELVNVLVKKSDDNKSIIMPGFTHLRVATPSTFGFWWQSYALQLIDELNILQKIYEVQDKSPLGAGTSYGVNWPINTETTSSLLGFAKSLRNALEEINSRGINEIHVLSSFASISTILSRMMEDVIIWSMPELDYIGIGEEHTTGSSIMPQKMNPDIAEKIRSQVGNITGAVISTLINIKGTPSGYNRDSADTKIAITQAMWKFIATLDIVSEMLSKIEPKPENMKKSIKTSLATKLADEICKNYQIPFRQTHEIIGSSIKKAGGDVEGIDNQLLQQSIFEVTKQQIELPVNFVNEIMNIERAIDQYQYKGSPNPKFIEEVNREAESEIVDIIEWNNQNIDRFHQSINKLISLSKKLNG
jgi:argininosuccinate lyase